MGERRAITDPSSGRGAWPVVVMSLLAVVVPTAGVLFFMVQAIRNERLAVRQKLEDAYRSQLLTAANTLQTFWKNQAAALTAGDRREPPGQTFVRLVLDGVADSVVVFDASGHPAYPRSPSLPIGPQKAVTPALRAARELEEIRGDPIGAAAAYARIAETATDPNAAAGAFRDQARCLSRAGRTRAAIDILTGTLSQDKYRFATDVQGRIVALDAMLHGLQLMKGPSHPGFSEVAEQLIRRVNDYGDHGRADIPSSQRRFIMNELRSLVPGCPAFATLAAENLAAEYLDHGPSRPEALRLCPTPIREVWQFAPPGASIVAIFRQKRICDRMSSALREALTLPNAKIEIRAPEDSSPRREAFTVMPAGESLPGWELALYLEGANPFAAAADRQIAAYAWTGILVVVVIAVLVALVARYASRQIKLTRLRNDLIATVSHELKTPLASMRVLADTLLAGKFHDEGQTREYVGLIAKENARLSRLIDNFLTFSRMERHKRAFESAKLNVTAVVSEAVEAVRDRFDSPNRRLEVEVAPGLPTVMGDRDALVTVLVNLLDNAYKYTDDDKHVVLRAFAEDKRDGVRRPNGKRWVCLEVRDNGIGLSRGAVRRVFDRFFQVDRTLSRQAGGCGLGLSIVKFIVEAHGGSVDVTSRPGIGSTFTVRLPACGATEASPS